MQESTDKSESQEHYVEEDSNLEVMGEEENKDKEFYTFYMRKIYTSYRYFKNEMLFAFGNVDENDPKTCVDGYFVK